MNSLDDYNNHVNNAGGKEKIEKQHSLGKLTARERLEALFDNDSFEEIDSFQSYDFDKMPGDGVIVGYGKIHGRTAIATSQDFTIKGGTLGAVQAKKICAAMDKALELGVPYIAINDSGGARIEEGILSLSGYADIFYRNTLLSGVVPQISVILGPCAGGACYSPAITDFIFMTKNNSQMFITGPSVVKSVTSEDITANELGGSTVHSVTSGVSHFLFEDELSCLNGVRQLLGYLPQNLKSKTIRTNKKTIQKKFDLPSNSRNPYDVVNVIDSITDDFFEVQKFFARNIVIGFARLNGETLGIVANQPNCLAGSLDINASDKASRFIRFCDCFNIPLLSLVDVPAFLPGSLQEHNGIIRHGAKLLYAFAEATVPKVSVIMRKAYGGAYIAMNSKGLGADIVYSWPNAEIAVMGAEGAVSIIAKKASEQEKANLIKDYNEKFMNPYFAAKNGYVDDVIEIKDTVEKISFAFDFLKTKEIKPISKKHGNIPL